MPPDEDSQTVTGVRMERLRHIMTEASQQVEWRQFAAPLGRYGVPPGNTSTNTETIVEDDTDDLLTAPFCFRN